MIKSYSDLKASVQAMDTKSVVAVVCAHDEHTLDAIVTAQKDGIISSVLIGIEDKIKEILKELGEDPANYEIIPSDDVDESLKIAVDLIHSGKANVMMKGKLETAQIMRAVLKKENDLRKGGLISVTGFFEIPGVDKLIAVSDMAVNTYPDLDGKKHILENAVHVMHALGIENPKVAVLAAVEKVNPKMPETVDADALKQMNISGEITGCTVEGPISFDIATSKEAAEIKGFNGAIKGDADLLLVPDIVSGNILAKCLTGFAHAITAGVVVGAKIPIILVPRSAAATDKYYSIALAAYTAQNF